MTVCSGGNCVVRIAQIRCKILQLLDLLCKNHLTARKRNNHRYFSRLAVSSAAVAMTFLRFLSRFCASTNCYKLSGPGSNASAERLDHQRGSIVESGWLGKYLCG